MNFIDLMICVFYKFYRKKNEQSIASFFAKLIFSILFFFLFIGFYKSITNRMPFENIQFGNGFIERRISGFLMGLPFFIIVFFITSKSKRYEEYELSESEYKKGWSLLFGLLGIIVLLFLYTVAR